MQSMYTLPKFIELLYSYKQLTLFNDLRKIHFISIIIIYYFFYIKVATIWTVELNKHAFFICKTDHLG